MSKAIVRFVAILLAGCLASEVCGQSTKQCIQSDIDQDDVEETCGSCESADLEKGWVLHLTSSDCSETANDCEDCCWDLTVEFWQGGMGEAAVELWTSIPNHPEWTKKDTKGDLEIQLEDVTRDCQSGGTHHCLTVICVGETNVANRCFRLECQPCLDPNKV